MLAGYSARCKVCNSPHRAEIEKWCKEEGVSTREAARRLAELGEKVSHEAIRRHMIEHFDVKAEAREQYQKSKQQMQQLVQKQLSDIEMLERVSAENYELSRQTLAWLTRFCAEQGKAPPSALVNLHEKLTAEMRQAIKQKMELLGDDPLSRVADGIATWTDIVKAADADEDE